MATLIKPCQVEGLQKMKSDLEAISNGYSDNMELLQQLKESIDDIMGDGSSEMSLPELARLNKKMDAELNGGDYVDSEGNSVTVSGLKNKKVQDVVKVEFNLTTGLNADRVTAIDSSKILVGQALKAYSVDNLPIVSENGGDVTVTFNSDYSIATFSVSPFMIDVDATRDSGSTNDDTGGGAVTYKPFTGTFKVFLVGEWTLDQLPSNALLDNNEMQLIAYDQVLQKITLQLAKDKALISRIITAVGSTAISEAIARSTKTIDNRIDKLEGNSYRWDNIVGDDGSEITDYVIRSSFDPDTGEMIDDSSDEVLIGEGDEEVVDELTPVLSATQTRKEISALSEKMNIIDTALKSEFLNRIKYNADVLLRSTQAKIDALSAHKNDIIAPAALGLPAIKADVDGILTQLQDGGITSDNIKTSDGITSQIKDKDTVLQDIVAAEGTFDPLTSYVPTTRYVDDAIKIAVANAEKNLKAAHRDIDTRVDIMESVIEEVEHIVPAGETITLAHTPDDVEKLELNVNGLVYYTDNGYFSVSGKTITWNSSKATFTLASVCSAGTKVTVKYKWTDTNKITPI